MAEERAGSNGNSIHNLFTVCISGLTTGAATVIVDSVLAWQDVHSGLNVVQSGLPLSYSSLLKHICKLLKKVCAGGAGGTGFMLHFRFPFAHVP